MDERKSRLLQLIRELSYAEGDFTLASGRKSTFYLDLRQTTLHPEGATLIGVLLLEAIGAHFGEATGVGGLTMGADPIATAVSVASWAVGRPLPAFVVRKEAKGHGARQWMEGKRNLPAGASLVIVEDVVTSGGSALTAARRVEEEGYRVAGIAALVDRLEGGRGAIEAEGRRLFSLFTIGDVRVVPGRG